MFIIKVGTISSSLDVPTFDCEVRMTAFPIQKCWEGSPLPIFQASPLPVPLSLWPFVLLSLYLSLSLSISH